MFSYSDSGKRHSYSLEYIGYERMFKPELFEISHSELAILDVMLIQHYNTERDFQSFSEYTVQLINIKEGDSKFPMAF